MNCVSCDVKLLNPRTKAYTNNAPSAAEVASEGAGNFLLTSLWLSSLIWSSSSQGDADAIDADASPVVTKQPWMYDMS